jgi:hypothetical protein
MHPAPLVGPTGPLLVTLKKLVVRREERDRVEQDRKVFRRPALAEPRDIKRGCTTSSSRSRAGGDLIESDGHRRCRLRIQLRSATNPFAAAE